MNIDRQIQYWRQTALDDFDTALLLVRNGKTANSLFFGHLALEKALKSVVCKVTESTPPYIHELTRLAALTGLDINMNSNAF